MSTTNTAAVAVVKAPILVSSVADLDTPELSSDFTISGYEGKIESTDASQAARKIVFVPFDKINIDLSRNPRMHGVYGSPHVKKLGRSIYENGLQEPITVSKRKDGSYWLLKGHLRMAAIKTVKVEGLPGVEAELGFPAKAAVIPEPEFMSKVQCIVLEGLSTSDEIDILMDHGMVRKLTRQEEYRAVKTMLKYGFTQQFIADKINKSRSAVSKFCWIATMPSIVDQFFTTEGKTVNDETIRLLNNAYNEDLKANDCRIKERGPKFNAIWKKFEDEGQANRVKAMTRDALRDAAGLQDDVDIREMLIAISDSNVQDLGLIIERLKTRLVPVGLTAIHANVDLVDEPTTFIQEGIESTVHTPMNA